MYCAQCGHPLTDRAAVCEKCGSPVGATPASVEAVAAAGAVFAGFWRRAAAYLVDSLVLLVPNVVVAVALHSREPLSTLAQLAMWWLYKALMESGARQATVGKIALGIKVTDANGSRISFGRASGRFFASLLSAIPLGIGYLMAGFTARKRALHDMIAGTLVVRATASESEAREGSGTMPLTAGVWAAIVLILFFPMVGILAAVSIPAYQDYTIRVKMGEAVREGRALQDEAAREIAEFRRGAQGAAAPTREVTPVSPYVTQVVIDKRDGWIELAIDPARMGARGGGSPGVRWTLLPDAQWKCQGHGIPDKYLPPDCRH